MSFETIIVIIMMVLCFFLIIFVGANTTADLQRISNAPTCIAHNLTYVGLGMSGVILCNDADGKVQQFVKIKKD